MSGLAAVKDHAYAGRTLEAGAALRRALTAGMSYSDQTAAAKLLDRLCEDPSLQAFRLGVLGSTTTVQLVPLLRLHAFGRGLRLEVYEAPFGLYRQEILDPASALYRFQPQAVLLFVNHRDAEPGDPAAEAARWENLWKVLRERSRCSVLMNNFALPVERPLGNLDASRGESGRLRRLNALFAERSGDGVCILDQEHLSSVMGKEAWFDERFWHHSRQAMSFSALARYGAEAAALLAALAGRSHKALVVDLDNTLWGGVVGEDGVDGISLEGGFLEFQRYLKSLKERGVLLAVCSKNDEAAAKEPFLRRREMVLGLDDFSDFRACWEDKPSVIRQIARRLNIGLDAVAFFDDSPMEREAVSAFLPEVAVVPAPADPAEYVRALDSLRLFEPTALSAEDAARADHFRAERAREGLRGSTADLGSFLMGLGMEADLGAFREADVPRIAQLVNKTNQFNLLTRRTTEAEVSAQMGDAATLTLAGRLRDRFGDYGLVAVLIARHEGDVLSIENWLMSCRVLGRGLEFLFYNRLLDEAKRLGCSRIVGRYVPTAKNALVKDLYASLGFVPSGTDGWSLAMADAVPKEVYIADGSTRPS